MHPEPSRNQPLQLAYLSMTEHLNRDTRQLRSPLTVGPARRQNSRSPLNSASMSHRKRSSCCQIALLIRLYRLPRGPPSLLCAQNVNSASMSHRKRSSCCQIALLIRLHRLPRGPPSLLCAQNAFERYSVEASASAAWQLPLELSFLQQPSLQQPCRGRTSEWQPPLQPS